MPSRRLAAAHRVRVGVHAVSLQFLIQEQPLVPLIFRCLDRVSAVLAGGSRPATQPQRIGDGRRGFGHRRGRPLCTSISPPPRRRSGLQDVAPAVGVARAHSSVAVSIASSPAARNTGPSTRALPPRWFYYCLFCRLLYCHFFKAGDFAQRCCIACIV